MLEKINRDKSDLTVLLSRKAELERKLSIINSTIMVLKGDIESKETTLGIVHRGDQQIEKEKFESSHPEEKDVPGRFQIEAPPKERTIGTVRDEQMAAEKFEKSHQEEPDVPGRFQIEAPPKEPKKGLLGLGGFFGGKRTKRKRRTRRS